MHIYRPARRKNATVTECFDVAHTATHVGTVSNMARATYVLVGAKRDTVSHCAVGGNVDAHQP